MSIVAGIVVVAVLVVLGLVLFVRHQSRIALQRWACLHPQQDVQGAARARGVESAEATSRTLECEARADSDAELSQPVVR